MSCCAPGAPATPRSRRRCRTMCARPSRPTNIRVPSNSSTRCQKHKPASCSASSCAAWRRQDHHRNSRADARVKEKEMPMSDRQTKPSRGPTKLLPAGWPSPKGYANGMKARGDLIFVAGQIGWDTHCKLADGFLPQVRQALQNIVAVLAEGGAGPEHVVRLTWYVKDVPAYRRSLAELGKIYREIMGRN